VLKVTLSASALWLSACATPTGYVQQDNSTGTSTGLPWLAACWVDPSDGSREVWDSVPSGMMFGYGVAYSGGNIVFFEHLRITQNGNDMTYSAMPNGGAGTDFVKTEQSDSRVLFANPEHDFPQEILYELKSDKLHATISKTNGVEPITFVKQRCGGT
jgi:hypothetical protein